MRLSIGLLLKKISGQLSRIEAKLRFSDLSSTNLTMEELISSSEIDDELVKKTSSLNAWKEFFSQSFSSKVYEFFSIDNLRQSKFFIEWLIFEQKIACREAFKTAEDIVNWVEFASKATRIKQSIAKKEPKKENIVSEIPQIVFKIATENTTSTIRGITKKRKTKATDLDFIVEDVPPSEITVPEFEYDPNERPMKEGRTAYAPIPINSAFSRNRMYYPIQTIFCEKEIDKDGKEKLIEHIETVIIRSDKTIQRVAKSELPDGANAHQRIYRLTDGTLISALPKPSDYATWSWQSISDFINGSSQPEPLDEMLYVMHDHLRSRVWLPSESDYWLLTLIAAASYCQTIFDAVPLVLLNGPAGSGKSEISAAMVEISANSVMLGTVSASTMIRAIDAASGLCVLDDLEAIGVGRGSNKKGNFSEIAQIIKVSYKKDSATKMITNTSTGRQEVLNFYGIKIISATLVPDSILASRMLYIHTKHMTKDDMEDFKLRERFDEDTISDLVDRMHTWTFSNVGNIRGKYEELFSSKSNRDDEISAPLKVLAELSGDKTIIENLEKSLANQQRRKNKETAPEKVLMEVVEKLVLSGYYTVSIFHLMMELRRELDPGYNIDYAKEVPGWSKPEWIGRILRSQNIAAEEEIRKRLYGSNLRAIVIKKTFIKQVFSKHEKEQVDSKNVFDFCINCESCPYAKLSCEIKAKKKSFAA